jgi:hypothetical protein
MPATDRPNIVFILADNVGWGDWSCWIPRPRRWCRWGAGGDRVTGGLPGMGHHPGAGGRASEDEVTDVLLAIAPVAGLGRVTGAVPTWRPRQGMTSRPRWGIRLILTVRRAPEQPASETGRSPRQRRAGSKAANLPGVRRARPGTPAVPGRAP